MQIKRSCPMISTNKLDAVREFYTKMMGFRIVFDGKGYLSFKAPGGDVEIAFMTPCEGQPEHAGGLTLSLLVDDPDKEHDTLRKLDVPVVRPLQDNPWGDRSFVALDPAGVGLYIFKEIPMSEEFRSCMKE